MRQAITPILLSLLTIAGCGDSSDKNGNIPTAASEMESELKANMARFMPMIANSETSLIFVLNPGMAPDMTISPYAGPGVPVTFSGTFDKNGDGIKETTISNGQVTFNSNPDDFSVDWGGMSGQATIDVSLPVLGHLYHGNLAFSIQSDQRQLSGSGTFTVPLSGTTTTVTIPDASPLVLKAADGTAGAVPNACGYSLSGQVQVVVAGPDGTLTSNWNFNAGSPSVTVNGASFTDTASNTTALPDSSVSLACASGGNLNDWVGTFLQTYACFPRESGQALLTLTSAGPNTISINDEDPPASGDSKTYPASVLGASAHVVRGSFVGGPAGNHYTENFNWTLSGSGNSFSQISLYQYTEGPKTGYGGICAATAKRVP